MIDEVEVRAQIASLIAQKISLATFERWLASKSWGMFSDGSANEAIRLVAAVNLAVSELHDDVIDVREFRRELLSMLGEIKVSRPLDARYALGSFGVSPANRRLVISAAQLLAAA